MDSFSLHISFHFLYLVLRFKKDDKEKSNRNGQIRPAFYAVLADFGPRRVPRAVEIGFRHRRAPRAILTVQQNDRELQEFVL